MERKKLHWGWDYCEYGWNWIYRRFWSVCFDKMSRAARDAIYADQSSIDDL